jgi:hypothetical protein
VLSIEFCVFTEKCPGNVVFREAFEESMVQNLSTYTF